MKQLLAMLLWGMAAACAAQPLPAAGTVEVLFSPWDDAEGAIIRALGEARTSVHVQAFLLTSRTIAKALQEASKRGVDVKVMADGEMAGKGVGSQLPALAAAGIPVWLETRYSVAHNKVMLIDVATATPVVITGSYNFTWSAQARNAENLLILRKNPALAQRYLNNWQRHCDAAASWEAWEASRQDMKRNGGNE